MTGWAVVTGASGGLGAGFAKELARQGADLILVARSADKLETLADELRARYRIQVETWPCDLVNRGARAVLAADLASREIHTLVNNAGFGSIGDFTDLPQERISAEVELNVVALTDLTRTVLPGMKQRDRGAVINIASTAAFQPIPGFTTYAATKSYVLRLSIGLWAELHDTGVRVLAVCPGPTDTGFFSAAGNDQVMGHRRSVEQVVATSFKALRRHRPYVVDGVGNTIMAEATRLVPATWVSQMAGWIASH
ncbi:MAG: SDR family oxidoreductase [Propionibacterium sp.]|jgi:oxidoreductase, short chain dehydrogenase/reductase family protein|nr:SDR family oxidoreductase [Propionibacterium sp.]